MIKLVEAWEKNKKECNEFNVVEFLAEQEAEIEVEMGDIAHENYVAGFKEGEEKKQAELNRDYMPKLCISHWNPKVLVSKIIEDDTVMMSENTAMKLGITPGKEKCWACNDTGWYGDNGPGRKGNAEYIPCDQCTAIDRARRKHAKEKP